MLSHESAAFSASTAPLPARRLLTERFGVFYADIRRFWVLPIMLAVFYAIWLAVPGTMNISGDGRVGAVEGYFGFLGTLAFLIGIAAISDDRDKGTISLLGELPISPWRLLIDKLAASFLLVILFHFSCEILYLVFQSFHGAQRPMLISSLGSYGYPALWNFGVWLPLSLVQVATLVCIGVAAGSALPNFIAAAILGMGSYVVWYTLWVWGLQPLEREWARGFHLAMTVQFLLLGAIALAVFLRTLKSPGFAAEWRNSIGAGPATEAGAGKVSWRPGWLKIPGSKAHRPYKLRMVVTSLLLATIGVYVSVVTFQHPDASPELGPQVLLYVTLPGVIIGVWAFSRHELSGTTGLIYWQPVSRSRLLWPRLRATAAFALVAAFPGSVSFLLIRPEDLPYILALIIGSAMLGALARLFYFNLVFPLVLATGTAAIWMGCYAAVMVTTYDRDVDSYPASYVCWACAIVLLLPLIAILTAYTKSDLLVINPAKRVGTGIAVLFSVGILGALLISALPGELAWLIGYWIRNLLHISGGA